ncbi:MAG: hypothetical protein J0M17_05385 [Planctomycetes bacterium]|nr:hypothetical protein [Planctomycetota bacterium]
MRIGSCIVMVLLACTTLAGAALRAAEQGSPSTKKETGGNATSPAAQKWAEFAPAGLGFRIELSGKPVDHSGWVGLPTSKIYAWNFALTDEAGGRTTNVIVNTLKEAPAETALLFQRALESIVIAVQGKLEDSTDVKVGEFAARDWRIGVEGGSYLHGRMVSADRRLYQVIVESKRKELDADERRIVDSLQIEPSVELTEPARAHDWRWVTPEGETLAVEMPDDPRETKDRRETALGEAEARVLSWTSTDGTTRYEAAALKLPRTPTADEATKLLKGEAATVAGRPGRSWTEADDDRTIHHRAVISGDRLYELRATLSREPTADDRKFLESLKLPK